MKSTHLCCSNKTANILVNKILIKFTKNYCHSVNRASKFVKCYLPKIWICTEISPALSSFPIFSAHYIDIACRICLAVSIYSVHCTQAVIGMAWTQIPRCVR